MKKIITTIIFAVAFGMNLSAQSDGFFSNGSYSEYRGDEEQWGSAMPVIPGQHGLNFSVQAPLGSGLLILGGMALAYGMRKRN